MKQTLTLPKVTDDMARAMVECIVSEYARTMGLNPYDTAERWGRAAFTVILMA